MALKSARSPSLGCGYLLVVTFVACVLLILNGVVVHAAMTAYEPLAPREFNEPRVHQAIRFVMPVVLIFMEYYLYDWAIDRLGRRVVESEGDTA